ncbi:MAG: NlpC/P60 family protein [Hyphomicrobiales bacterium]
MNNGDRRDSSDMINQLLLCPYARGRGDLNGADCWGIVELWYLHVLGIALDDRAAHPPGHQGVQAGYEVVTHWQPIEPPENHCLVVMRAGLLNAGHVGIYLDGCLLHSDEKTGCVYQPISDRFIRSKISGYLKHQ